MASDARMDAVEFLVGLVCGAPADRLVEGWRRLGREGLRPAVMEEAARLRVRSALGSFCAGLPAEDLDETAEVAVTALAFGRARTEEAIALALDLCRSAQVERRRAVFVKGAALVLAGLFSGEREFGDVDVVVEPEEVLEWRAAAAGVGAAWEPTLAGGYEIARVVRAGALVELHSALPGDGGHVAGPDFGALWSRSVPATASVVADLRVPRHHAAREISVHHAVFHHRGDAEYVLRALQDVARLEAGEVAEGDGLYGREDVRFSVALFRRIATEWVSGRLEDHTFRGVLLEGLLREGVDSNEERFARGVDNWIDASRREGRNPLAFALRQAFARGTQPKPFVSRFSGLVGRYVAGRFGHGAARRRREEEMWLSFLMGRGTPPRAS